MLERMNDCEVSFDGHRNRDEDRTDSTDVPETETHRKDEHVDGSSIPEMK